MSVHSLPQTLPAPAWTPDTKTAVLPVTVLVVLLTVRVTQAVTRGEAVARTLQTLVRLVFVLPLATEHVVPTGALVQAPTAASVTLLAHSLAIVVLTFKISVRRSLGLLSAHVRLLVIPPAVPIMRRTVWALPATANAMLNAENMVTVALTLAQLVHLFVSL